MERSTKKKKLKKNDLTELQRNIITLLAKDKSIKEISQELKIGMWRVKENLRDVYVIKELRNITGKTPQQFLLDERIFGVKEQLINLVVANPEITIQELVDKTGLNGTQVKTLAKTSYIKEEIARRNKALRGNRNGY